MTKTPPVPDRRVPVRRTFNARFSEGLSRVLARLKVEDVPHIKRIIITVVGGTLLVIGVALVFLPGPGSLVILGGLALLGTEYAWARRLMRKGKLMAHKALSKTQKIFSFKDKSPASAPVSAEKSAGPVKAAAVTDPLDDGEVSLVH